MSRPKRKPGNATNALKTKAPKSIASTQSLSSIVKSIFDVMHSSNCASFSPALNSSYRWQDWAASYSDKPNQSKTRPCLNTQEHKPFGWKLQELFDADGKLFEFINKPVDVAFGMSCINSGFDFLIKETER